MIKAIVFDMDGLMIDSEPLNSKAVSEVIKEYGKVPISKENGLVHTAGLKGDKQWEELRVVHNIEERIQVLREKRRKAYLEIIKTTSIQTMPGLMDLLRLLKKKNIPLALASNTGRKHIQFILDKLKLFHYFPIITTGDEVVRPKPNPDIYIKTAKKLSTTTSYCLVLEDSESGVIAGKKAGMKVIAVPNVYTQNQDFTGADLVTSSLKNITWHTIAQF